MALSFLALFIIFAVIVGGAATVGILVTLFSRLRRLEGGGFDDANPRQLSDQMNGMVEELMALQAEVADLSERLDFTEKLLTGGDRGPADGESNPPIRRPD
jgi:hypothetical protein